MSLLSQGFADMLYVRSLIDKISTNGKILRTHIYLSIGALERTFLAGVSSTRFSSYLLQLILIMARVMCFESYLL